MDLKLGDKVYFCVPKIRADKKFLSLWQPYGGETRLENLSDKEIQDLKSFVCTITSLYSEYDFWGGQVFIELKEMPGLFPATWFEKVEDENGKENADG